MIDRQPRQLDDTQREALRQLAVAAVHALQARRANVDARAAGEVVGDAGPVEDVTEHRRMAALIERTGRIAGVGGWELDLRTQALTWSAQTRLIHEVADDHVPQLASAIGFYAEDVRQQMEAAVEMGIAEGLPWDLELPLVTARGRQIWVRSQGSVELEAGRAVRLAGAVQDITEQRSRRLQLLQEQALRTTLQTQMAHTERLLRERSEMLDVMAHEVRQPLNNASAAMQSASRALAGLSEEDASPRLARAQTVLAQVLASIDNTLAVAALLSTGQPIERADTDIDALLQVAIADVPQPQRQRIRIQRHTLARTASMDMHLMRLALRNLLNNALQHSPDDAPVVMHLRDSEDPLALLIDVADAGSGIAADLLPRLFEHGIHRHQPRARRGQGLGLGLYIVGRVMALHAGSVQLLANGPQGVHMRLVVIQSHTD
ncbi:MAG: HAMP domain-containing sensor histidine kinase [Aquabacterium sp.]|nr:HAMP domain-containing sensor histidine kinase [Aquabacterium sp.]